jgi:hypothetical protein
LCKLTERISDLPSPSRSDYSSRFAEEVGFWNGYATWIRIASELGWTWGG